MRGARPREALQGCEGHLEASLGAGHKIGPGECLWDEVGPYDLHPHLPSDPGLLSEVHA